MNAFEHLSTEELKAMLNRQMSADGFSPTHEFVAAMNELQQRQHS